MAWAWSTRLPPMPKLVLMALADEADDSGFCFPSQRRLAWKCTISERTARRMVSLLASQSYVTIEPRFAKNRSRTSNGYRLAVGDPPDNLTGGPRTPRTGGPGHTCPGAPDSADRVTTTYPLFNPKPQPRDKAPDRVERRSDRDDNGRGCGGDVCFPEGLTPTQRRGIRDHLGHLDRAAAQQLLDELTGRMRVDKINSPLRYLSALVSRWQRSEFVPDLGLAIAAERRPARHHDEQASAASLSPPVQPPDTDCARLPAAIRASLERLRPRLETHGIGESSNAKLSVRDDDHSASKD